MAGLDEQLIVQMCGCRLPAACTGASTGHAVIAHAKIDSRPLAPQRRHVHQNQSSLPGIRSG